MLFATGAPNLQGAIDMGLHPAALPGGDMSDEDARAACGEAWGRPLVAQAGKNANEIFDGLSSGDLKGLYVLGCDPVAEHPDGARAREALDKADFVVLQTSHLNASAEYADVVIPAPTLYEETGSVTNLERRAQALPRALKPMIDKMIPEAWRAFADIAKAMERPMRANSLDKIRIQARALIGDYADAFSRVPDEGLHLRTRGAARLPDRTDSGERGAGVGAQDAADARLVALGSLCGLGPSSGRHARSGARPLAERCGKPGRQRRRTRGIRSGRRDRSTPRSCR